MLIITSRCGFGRSGKCWAPIGWPSAGIGKHLWRHSGVFSTIKCCHSSRLPLSSDLLSSHGFLSCQFSPNSGEMRGNLLFVVCLSHTLRRCQPTSHPLPSWVETECDGKYIDLEFQLGFNHIASQSRLAWRPNKQQKEHLPLTGRNLE